MAVMSVRRSAAKSCRNAITLIEIMASVMVLSIGLVGVLAAIPFGGMRMAQMNEADYSSAVGRLGVRMMKINGWADPNNWYLKDNANNAAFASNNNSVRTDSGGEFTGLNLTFPYVIDPLASNQYVPSFRYADYRDNAHYAFYTRVSPVIGTGKLRDDLPNLFNRYERAFFLPDDIAAGYDLSEDETELRPYLETEKDRIVGEGEIPSFTGRYSWMASVYPKSNADTFFNSSLRDINNADFDVVVFKDRIINDERILTVNVDGTGYQGGTVTLDLTSMKGGDGDDKLYNTELDKARLIEQFQNTKYIALMGKDDIPIGKDYPYFFRWYKIANYSIIVDEKKEVPISIRASLIGPNLPLSWLKNGGNSNTVCGVFFPGVVGVYSSSSRF